MRVLVTGDRDWKDRLLIKQHLTKLPPNTVIIEGGARGADSLANSVAKELGFDRTTYHANWTRHHKAGGPIRNKRMLTESNPDRVLAFHDNIEKSKGTKDMIKISKKAGKPVKLVSHENRGGKVLK